MSIKTEHLKELARLQEVKPINLKDSSAPGLKLLDNSIIFNTVYDHHGNPYPHKMENNILTSNSLKEILLLIEKKYNEDLEKRLADAKKAVWTDIGNGGI